MPEEIQTDEEGTVRIDYGEVLKAVAGGVVGSGLMSLTPIGILFPMFTALKALQKPQQPKPSDIDNICEIIKAGKEQGVKRLKIDTDKSTAVEVGAFVAGIGGKVAFQKQNHAIIEVEF